MSGIVNSTGARSGVIGTTVGSVTNINRPFIHLSQTTQHAIPNASDQLITFNTTVYDPDSYMADSGTKFLPTNGTSTYYYVTASLNIVTGSSDDYVQLKIYKSGSYVMTTQYVNRNSQTFQTAGVVNLNGSDEYLQAYIRHATGSSQNTGGDPAKCYFIAFALSI